MPGGSQPEQLSRHSRTSFAEPLPGVSEDDGACAARHGRLFSSLGRVNVKVVQRMNQKVVYQPRHCQSRCGAMIKLWMGVGEAP
jgi:hypothetical protein